MKPERTINFSVNDGTDAIEGATVTVDESTETTDSAGGCSISDVTDGEHTVTVTADGYTDYTGTITVSEDNTSFTISLTATRTLTFSVNDGKWCSCNCW